MNPEIKAKWVAALRSGEYDQVQGRLHDGENGFCCLGVLCDLHSKTNKSWWSEACEGINGELYCKYMGEDGMPPPDVYAWADLPRKDVSINGEYLRLEEHNDGTTMRAPKTFAQIADAIEAQL